MIDEEAAKRLGVIRAPLQFDGRLLTANGSLPATRHRIDHLAVAGHDLRDVQAIIVRRGDTSCLLGQDVLTRLDAVEMHGGKMVLR